jgi:N-formylglutamate amidohydrolase
MSAENDIATGPNATPQLPAYDLRLPREQTVPYVFSSPHSGIAYPDSFIAASRLDRLTLRRSEDSFVDELFGAAPDHGAPLLRALFPRSYVDPNREPFELDPAMFEDELPPYVNAASPRVAAGLGTVARVVANGQEIYAKKLRFADARARIEACWRPYHDALSNLLRSTRRQFGHCVLIDCHSMPSVGGPMERDAGRERVDFILGDCFGSSCAPHVIDRVEASLAGMGYAVARNTPYSGGFVTQHYGRPGDGIHTLQIEVNRGLYMDERTIERSAGFARLQEDLTSLIRDLGGAGASLAAE